MVTYIYMFSRCSYGLLAAISTLLKEQMQPHLEEIVEEMIASIKSQEGITVSPASVV